MAVVRTSGVDSTVYRATLLPLAAAAAVALAAPLGACGSFGAADEEVADGGPGPEGGADGAPADGAPLPPDGAAARDADSDASEPAPDGGKPAIACNASPAGCAPGDGCCLETAANTCRPAAGCDTFFVACQKSGDCRVDEVCCFDIVSTAATCVAAGACNSGTKRQACALGSECSSGNGANNGCAAMTCQSQAGAVVPFLDLCVGGMATPVSRGGLTCMVP